MSGEHRVTLDWANGPEPFAYETYPREHRLTMKEAVITASSSPVYKGDGKSPDPEELLVAALSSCHMLTFLYLAAKRGLVINRYEDAAEGVMTKNEKGRYWVSEVTLHPRIDWEGDAPDAVTQQELHHLAHEECFIANSVRTEVRCEPVE